MTKNTLWLTLTIAAIWGTSFPVSKVAINIIGPYAFRVAISIVSCVALFIVFNQDIIKSIKQLNLYALWKITLIAIPNIFLVPTLNSIALHYTSVTNATILVYTMPCFTSMILMGIEKKINTLSILSLVLCFMGIMLILKGIHVGTGELIILCSAVCWALGAVVSQKVISLVSFKAKLFWQMVISSLLISFSYPFFQDGALFPPIIEAFADVKCLLCVLYLGLVGNALAYYIWFSLIQNESAEFASYATLLSPIITVIIASVLMNENPTPKQLIGFAFILMSVVLVNIIKPFFVNRYPK